MKKLFKKGGALDQLGRSVDHAIKDATGIQPSHVANPDASDHKEQMYLLKGMGETPEAQAQRAAIARQEALSLEEEAQRVAAEEANQEALRLEKEGLKVVRQQKEKLKVKLEEEVSRYEAIEQKIERLKVSTQEMERLKTSIEGAIARHEIVGRELESFKEMMQEVEMLKEIRREAERLKEEIEREKTIMLESERIKVVEVDKATTSVSTSVNFAPSSDEEVKIVKTAGLALHPSTQLFEMITPEGQIKEEVLIGRALEPTIVPLEENNDNNTELAGDLNDATGSAVGK